MSQNTLSLAPDFNPHRSGLAAADTAAPELLHGVNSRDYAEAIVDVSNTGTLTSVELEAVFWSDASSKFVSDAPPQSFTLTEPGQFTVATRGRRFFIRVNSIAIAGGMLALSAAGAKAHP